MRKAMGRVGICVLAVAFFWCGTVVSDRQRLREELIRFHVVANSDSQEDQIRKLRIRDAVTKSLKSDLDAGENGISAGFFLRSGFSASFFGKNYIFLLEQYSCVHYIIRLTTVSNNTHGDFL